MGEMTDLRTSLFITQEWDQTSHFGLKIMHWLTPAHFERKNSFDRMNVGRAIDIMCTATARQLRRLRLRYAY